MAEHPRAVQKVKIFRDNEIDETGVTRVWTWVCTSEDCHTKTAGKGSALYWENAQMMALRHLKKWH